MAAEKGTRTGPVRSASADEVGPGVVLKAVDGSGDAGGSLVVGFDRGGPSRRALAVAVDLGRRLGAVLHVVHAIDLADYPVDPDGGDWEEQARLALGAERDEVTATLADYRWGWDYRAWRAEPALALTARADQVDALMIVVGTRGEGWRHLVERLLSPSVSHRLIHHGHRPVLVVGGEEAPAGH